MTPTRVAVYVRMTTNKQEDSPERQRDSDYPHCERKGYFVVDEYHDPGIAGDEFVKRPQFRRMLRDAADGKFDGIVVDQKDRLSRQHPIDYIADVVRPLRDAGVWVEAVATGRVDWDSMGGLLTDHVQQHQASEEPVNTAYRTLGSLLTKARAGEGCGGPAPYAYVMTYREETVKGRVKQVPEKYDLGDPDKVKVVKWLFKEYAAGRTLEWLRNELHARAVPGPRGTEWWGKSTIARILGNRRYLGDWVYNLGHCGKWAATEGGTVKKSTGGRKIKPRKNAREDWVVVPDHHPAIIDRELFAKVQGRLRENRENKTPHMGGGDFRLAHLLVCGQCGLVMWGFNERGEVKYRCSGNMRFGAGYCGCNTVREAPVLAAVVDTLQRELVNEESVARMEEKLRQEAEALKESGEADRLKDRLKELDKQIDQGNSNLVILPPDVVPGVVAKLREMKVERDHVQVTLDRLTNDSTLCDYKSLVATAQSLLWDLRQAVDLNDPADARRTLRDLVSRVELDFAPRAHRRNRSPLLGGTIYLRDDTGQTLQADDSSLVRSHSERVNGVAIPFRIGA